MHRKIPGFFFDGFPFRRPWDPSNMWKVKIIIRSLLQHLCLLRPDQGPLDNVQSMLPKSYLSMSFFSSPSSTSSSSSSKSSLGVQNMRQRVSTAARHFFYQALLHDLRDFYTILRDFCAILHDFYTILCNFCDVFARHKLSAARHLKLFCTPG